MVELAGCVVLDKQNRLLLHRNTKELTQWELPGGKREPGEALAETAARETREELKLDVDILRELGSAVFTDRGQEMHYTWFLAKTLGHPSVNEGKFDEYNYFSLKDLEELRLSPNVKNLIAAGVI